MSVHTQRCAQAQQLMAQRGIDWLLIPHSTDLRYLIGYAHRQSERLTLLMVPQNGEPRLVLPSFEIPVVSPYADFFSLIGWEENEDPVGVVRRQILSNGDQPVTLACGDDLHAVFLLRLQAALAEARYLPGWEVMATLRMEKSAVELEALRTAAAYTDQALASVLGESIVGQTERQVRSALHESLLARGCESVGTGIVGAGPNSASPHHSTGDRILEVGDPVVIDFGGSYRGYRSDMTRTVHLGPPSDSFIEVYEVVQEAQERAVAAVEPGVTAETIDQVARAFITEKGYGPAFLHRVGHGIGLDGHEYPYLVEGSTIPLRPGMTFSVEPGVYLSGRFGVRIEDVVRVTENGAERLNNFPRNLTVL